MEGAPGLWFCQHARGNQSHDHPVWLTLIALVTVYLVSPAPFLISHYCLFGGYQDGLCNNPTLKSTDLGAGRVESNLDSTDNEVGGKFCCIEHNAPCCTVNPTPRAVNLSSSRWLSGNCTAWIPMFTSGCALPVMSSGANAHACPQTRPLPCQITWFNL